MERNVNVRSDRGITACVRQQAELTVCRAVIERPIQRRRRIHRQPRSVSATLSVKMRTSSFIWKIKPVLVICLLLGSCRAPNVAPSINFSQVPPADEGGPERVETIAGRVSGAKPGQQIVLFARSGYWWVQPQVDKPFTQIQADSTWKNSTHLGTEYAAVLVEADYLPPATMEALPTPGGSVIAVAMVKGNDVPPGATKLINFSGYEWKVRSTTSERGGTVNLYDSANAWTDASGALHLRIARQGERWTCAEVQLTRSLGHGSYHFVVRDSSQLEPAAVLSLLTWDGTAVAQNHREIDIELARWGDPASKNAQYAIQPYSVPANVARFAAPAGVLTHSFRWEPGQVTFRTVRGKTANDNAVAVATHAFTSGVPEPGGETVHLNLYVFGNGTKPLQNEVEVIIENFEYLP
jgi:hypothetical protein